MAKSGEEIKPVEQISEYTVREGNISLILDSYDDIFSDFDPRSYSERSLSDDFLAECKKVARDKGEELELRIMVPRKLRNIRDEIKIKKRLKSHFHRHYLKNHEEVKKIKREGAAWFLIGAMLMIISTALYGETKFLYKLLEVMLVPASWFMFWEGLGKIFIYSNEKKPDYEFYKKMAHAQIFFLSY
jgi:hypothetical protein